MKRFYPLSRISRRHALAVIGGTALAASASATAFPASGQERTISDSAAGFLDGRATTGDGVILRVPELAENGNAVKVEFEINSPMTDADHVKAVYIFADANPFPQVAKFQFSPACGICRAATRLRLAESQPIALIAEMSDGSFRKAVSDIKVTIGGCAG